MSDRTDPGVRKLAEEITQEIYGAGASLEVVNSITDGEAARTLARWESRLAQREAALQAQLHRALGEGAGLRQVAERAEREITERLDTEYEVTGDRANLALLRSALSASPLSERAGAVLEEARSLDARASDPGCQFLVASDLNKLHDLLVALQTELEKGGEGG